MDYEFVASYLATSMPTDLTTRPGLQFLKMWWSDFIFYTKSGPIVVPFMSAFTQVALTSKFWVSASSLDTTPVCNRMLLQVCQSKVAWFNHCMLR